MTGTMYDADDRLLDALGNGQGAIGEQLAEMLTDWVAPIHADAAICAERLDLDVIDAMLADSEAAAHDGGVPVSEPVAPPVAPAVPPTAPVAPPTAAPVAPPAAPAAPASGPSVAAQVAAPVAGLAAGAAAAAAVARRPSAPPTEPSAPPVPPPAPAAAATEQVGRGEPQVEDSGLSTAAMESLPEVDQSAPTASTEALADPYGAAEQSTAAMEAIPAGGRTEAFAPDLEEGTEVLPGQDGPQGVSSRATGPIRHLPADTAPYDVWNADTSTYPADAAPGYHGDHADGYADPRTGEPMAYAAAASVSDTGSLYLPESVHPDARAEVVEYYDTGEQQRVPDEYDEAEIEEEDEKGRRKVPILAIAGVVAAGVVCGVGATLLGSQSNSADKKISPSSQTQSPGKSQTSVAPSDPLTGTATPSGGMPSTPSKTAPHTPKAPGAAKPPPDVPQQPRPSRPSDNNPGAVPPPPPPPPLPTQPAPRQPSAPKPVVPTNPGGNPPPPPPPPPAPRQPPDDGAPASSSPGSLTVRPSFGMDGSTRACSPVACSGGWVFQPTASGWVGSLTV
ncbi:hypothetical protein KEM60_00943 [Austwickia sp. TVS 96-490-7B]|uniref:hypothetical protein n=1 Tax=Austwickia sp. TVS 96-490-7B TaxID=2830843 RepID=UPI001C58C503|nr:hypothetical protein [Austwickia sp. TVS 96-490-7B]MBW3084754.1 hypothetical protein [Austwickia sp. TVS 96-490-7B]